MAASLGGLLILLLLSACIPHWGSSLFDPPSPTPTSTSTPTQTASPTATLTPTNTNTPLPPTLTPTPTWVFQPAGEIICPILLYHHVEDRDVQTRYNVPPAEFQAQMQLLKDWGYTAIPISLLVQAITQGTQLPPRPIVITFDDGNKSVYENAFPIMRELGFPGVNYIISSALNAQDYMTISDLQEMAVHGWEVGSHSLSHMNLLENHGQVWDQEVQSRQKLLDELMLPVDTFAYPYGAADGYVMEKTSQYGYKAAVGLGITSLQGPNNLYYLNRLEVRYDTTLDGFAALLPWTGPQP